MLLNSFLFTADKRKVYDKYGVDGLMNNGGQPSPNFAQSGFFQAGFPNAGFGFMFRDPNEIFREVFGNDPFLREFMNLGAPSSSHRRNHRQGQPGHHHHSHHQQAQHHPFGLNVFGGFPAFGGLGGFGGFGQMFDMMANQSFATTGIGGGMGGNAVSSIKNVNIVNGKVIEQSTVIQNGVKTTTVTENGRVVSRTVTDGNGSQTQSIQYNQH